MPSPGHSPPGGLAGETFASTASRSTATVNSTSQRTDAVNDQQQARASTPSLTQPVLPQPGPNAPPSTRRAGLPREAAHYSGLVLASMIGCLIRLGLEAMARYDGQIIFELAWAQGVGCGIMGLALGRKSDIDDFYPPLYTFLTTGVAGSVTTFSSWMLEGYEAFANSSGYSRSGFYDAVNGVAYTFATFAISYACLLWGEHVAGILPSAEQVRHRRNHRRHGKAQNEELSAVKEGHTSLPKPSTANPGKTLAISDYLVILSAAICYLIALLLYFLAPRSWRHRATFPILLSPPGAMLRYYLASFNTRSPFANRFHIGTFAANIAGSLIIGGVYAAQFSTPAHAMGLRCNALHALQQGFCGCLTTVSTFMTETRSIKGKRWTWVYVGTSIVLGHLAILVTFGAVESPKLAPGEELHALFLSLRQTAPRLIQSPPTQPRRASVALILRLKPAPGLVFEGHEPEGYTGEVVPQDDFGLGYGLEDFFRLPWVNHPLTTPELLFIRRAPASTQAGRPARWSSHIAFPGGRQEPTDESAQYTALRETWEEIGIDLAEKEFLQIGRLDEREITTSLGKRLLMILSPFVFLQTSPFSPPPDLQASEVSSVHWIPVPSLTPPFAQSQWSRIEIDVSSRMSPRNQLFRWGLRQLVGKMEFGCVLLPDEPDHIAEGFDPDNAFLEAAEGSGSWYDHSSQKRLLRLWGLSLGMTLDLLAHLPTASSSRHIWERETSPPLTIDTTTASTSAGPSALGPKTPVTVTSSFDDEWEVARRAIDRKSPAIPNGLTPLSSPPDGKTVPGSGNTGAKLGQGQMAVAGHSGAGLTSQGQLGQRVSAKTFKGSKRGVGPGVTAVFPRFSYPDINFWIWVFGRRYRKVVKGWEESVKRPGRANDRRINWSGAALSTFYSAVRQALVVAIIIRALATGLGMGGLGWWLYKRFSEVSAGEL